MARASASGKSGSPTSSSASSASILITARSSAELTVHLPGGASPLVSASAKGLQPGYPQAPQFACGSMSSTSSIRGSS